MYINPVLPKITLWCIFFILHNSSGEKNDKVLKSQKSAAQIVLKYCSPSFSNQSSNMMIFFNYLKILSVFQWYKYDISWFYLTALRCHVWNSHHVIVKIYAVDFTMFQIVLRPKHVFLHYDCIIFSPVCESIFYEQSYEIRWTICLMLLIW